MAVYTTQEALLRWDIDTRRDYYCDERLSIASKKRGLRMRRSSCYNGAAYTLLNYLSIYRRLVDIVIRL